MSLIPLSLRRQWLDMLLVVALALLSIQLYLVSVESGIETSEMMLRANQGVSDMALRNADFPRTYIATVHVDLTSPNHWVELDWTGPMAASQERGPFQSSPGRGTGDNNCDDVAESNRGQSQCTPKGKRVIEGFSDHMRSARNMKFVTWINAAREIGLHSHPEVPVYPASIGCVRLNEHAAQLIHNNSVVGKTEVIVEGTWTPPPATDTSH